MVVVTIKLAFLYDYLNIIIMISKHLIFSIYQYLLSLIKKGEQYSNNQLILV